MGGRSVGHGGTCPPDFSKSLSLTIGAPKIYILLLVCPPQFFRVPSQFSQSPSALLQVLLKLQGLWLILNCAASKSSFNNNIRSNSVYAKAALTLTRILVSSLPFPVFCFDYALTKSFGFSDNQSSEKSFCNYCLESSKF